MKLSIVVPIYNADKWLQRCVESLLNQGIGPSEYEILLIDDGSKDGSLAIANEFADANSNIRVFTQANAGPGAARNRGIYNAKGEYLMFVDADDYLKPNSLPPILDLAISNSLDLCFYHLLVYTKEVCFTGGGKVITTDICSGEYALRHEASIGSACSCLFYRDLLINYSINFTDIVHGEDTLFMTEVMARANKIKFCPETIYMYDCTKEMSTQQLLEREKGEIMDSLFIAKQTHKLASIKGISPKTSKFLKQRSNSIIVSQVLNVLKHKNKYGLSFVSEYFNRLYDLNLYPISGSTLSWRTTLLVPILNTLKPILPK